MRNCGIVQPPVNGYVNEDGTLVGDEIQFSCDNDNGYELVGADQAICLTTGEWSHEVPICTRKFNHFHYTYVFYCLFWNFHIRRFINHLSHIIHNNIFVNDLSKYKKNIYNLIYF